MNMNSNYPYEIKDVDPEESTEIFKSFSAGFQDGFLRIGPKGYFYTNGIREDAPKLYNMPLRPDDVFVITIPKAGTTWTQELVWMVANDLDYETSNSTILPMRFPFIEMSFLLNSDRAVKAIKDNCKGNEHLTALIDGLLRPGSEIAASLPSPRYMKTHMPLSLLPPTLLDTAKVVYVARDPRDLAVSYYNHVQLFLNVGFTGDFKTFWKHFIKGQVDWCPFFPHVLEAWEQRHHPNMLFMFYEDMLKDLPAVVNRVADFLGKKLNEEQVAKLCDHLHFDNFKKNKSVNYEYFREVNVLNQNCIFMRKGKAGGWRDYFDEEMSVEADRWIEESLRGTDLRFPTV